MLGVFAHPDDETTSAGGAIAHYARQGVDVHVLTASRGEEGTLGTGGASIEREDLPAVRETELRSVMKLLGANPPELLDYLDGQVEKTPLEELAARILAVMRRVGADVVITHGPTGISGHADHIAVHKAAVEAFHRYAKSSKRNTRLFYGAITPDVLELAEVDLVVEGPEAEATAIIDVSAYLDLQIEALRMYRSQEDAQYVAELFEKHRFGIEAFHQAWPPVSADEVAAEFWE